MPAASGGPPHCAGRPKSASGAEGKPGERAARESWNGYDRDLQSEGCWYLQPLLPPSKGILRFSKVPARAGSGNDIACNWQPYLEALKRRVPPRGSSGAPMAFGWL